MFSIKLCIQVRGVACICVLFLLYPFRVSLLLRRRTGQGFEQKGQAVGFGICSLISLATLKRSRPLAKPFVCVILLCVCLSTPEDFFYFNISKHAQENVVYLLHSFCLLQTRSHWRETITGANADLNMPPPAEFVSSTSCFPTQQRLPEASNKTWIKDQQADLSLVACAHRHAQPHHLCAQPSSMFQPVCCLWITLFSVVSIQTFRLISKSIHPSLEDDLFFSWWRSVGLGEVGHLLILSSFIHLFSKPI